MRKKQIMLVFLAFLLLLPAFLVNANTNVSTPQKTEGVVEEGKLASKDEVVYANLQATGQLDEIYVVNILDVTKAGLITDYGMYSSIKNLTDLSEIEQGDGTIVVTAPEGKFYYQGNIHENGKLPWNVQISYLLDGKEISPEDLPGKNGHVQIHIFTAPNEGANPVFYENYLLQVSLTLAHDIFSNIEAPDGMMANVGKNTQVTFTVMPNRKGELSLHADANDFELQGIEIAAVPMSMSIDTPNIDEMTDDIETLSDAIKEINKGVGELKDGISQLNDGVTSLRDGSKEFLDGISTVDGASSELVGASASINEALHMMSVSLNDDSAAMDMTELQNLPGALLQIAGGLTETATGLTLLRDNYLLVYNSLDQVMMAIPEHNITEDQIQQLYMSGANKTVVDQLVETYTAARTAKGTYAAVKEGFTAVDTTLKQVSGSLKEMSNGLSSIAGGLSDALENMDDLDGFAQLQEGLATLAANYKEFHAGLQSYTNGVGQLSSSYNELHSGIVELSDGTGEFEDGMTELHEGTTELYEATKDLPEQLEAEIDSMIAEYNNPDFEPISLISTKNEKINSVQFIIKTKSIKKEEPKTEKVSVEEEVKGFWARLVNLFSFIKG